MPGGSVGRRARLAACRRLFASCGEHVNVEQGAWFGSGRDVIIGHRSGIGKDALVMGPVTIGDDVMMGPRVLVLGRNHVVDDTARPMREQGLGEARPVVIEDDVWIGAGAVLLPGRRIGRGSVVAAACVVTKDVAPYSVVGGNPMRQIGHRGSPT
ncbi:DapH/DapD/GlmU-related protein [Pseudokineococcus basanitobsidens]|uniref:DapH/DapD/GlmU-related protein n=1 Tax=Pseudokineococcus basanitobsidens TaxID=1926649 RepID=A0ABU8RI13_9ACTN